MAMDNASLVSLTVPKAILFLCAIPLLGPQRVECAKSRDADTYPVRVELRLNSTSKSYGETNEHIIGECTNEFTILVGFVPEEADPRAGSEGRQYRGVVLDASRSVVCVPEDYGPGNGAGELEKLRGHISKGELRAVVSVDSHGRWEVRSDSPEELSGYSQTYFQVIASMLWAPAPPDGKPFEAGMKWKEEPHEEVLTCEQSVHCESVEVWPSGETRIVLTSEGEVERPNKDGSPGHFLKIREKGEWILEGNPPAVHRATGHQWSQFRGRIMDVTTAVRLEKGGIPIRP
jgi:hypothetical protein